MNPDLPALPPAFAPDYLRERVILITGAGDGLGKAAALAAARHGASVILLGRTVRKLEAVYDQIEAAGGPTPAIYPLNLAGANWGDYGELAATLDREFGRLDGLVHCAAHFKTFTRLEDLDPREWLETLQVNLTAAFSLTQQLLPLLRAGDEASVVFVSDAAGRTPKAFHGAYGVSKAALESLARTWALELGPGQPRLNTYYPGPLRTGLRLKGYPGETLEQVPSPESAVPRLLWLLGPESRALSGCAV
jgi:NAD(P)-dependent dehydrogenase (short-subunit alcohol dehydrogenase family)